MARSAKDGWDGCSASGASGDAGSAAAGAGAAMAPAVSDLRRVEPCSATRSSRSDSAACFAARRLAFCSRFASKSFCSDATRRACLSSSSAASAFCLRGTRRCVFLARCRTGPEISVSARRRVQGRVAATPRLPRGYSVEVGLGDAAAGRVHVAGRGDAAARTFPRGPSAGSLRARPRRRGRELPPRPYGVGALLRPRSRRGGG